MCLVTRNVLHNALPNLPYALCGLGSQSKEKKSQISRSHTSAKRSSAMREGWERLRMNDRLYWVELSDSDESGIRWPNENLGPRYNNLGKPETKFRQLDMRALVAGKLAIACNCGVPTKRERGKAVGIGWYELLLGTLSMVSSKFHVAVLSEVQKGNMPVVGRYQRCMPATPYRLPSARIMNTD